MGKYIEGGVGTPFPQTWEGNPINFIDPIGYRDRDHPLQHDCSTILISINIIDNVISSLYDFEEE